MLFEKTKRKNKYKNMLTLQSLDGIIFIVVVKKNDL